MLHISKKKRRGRPSSSHAHTDDSYFPEHEVDSSPPRYSSPYLSPSSTSSGSPSVHPDSAQLSEASCLMQPAKSDSFQPESPLSSISTSEKQQEEVMDSLRSPAQTNSSVLPTSSQQYMSSTPSLSSLYGILDGRNAPRAMIHFPCWRDPKSNSIFSFLLGGRLRANPSPFSRFFYSLSCFVPFFNDCLHITIFSIVNFLLSFSTFFFFFFFLDLKNRRLDRI